jgi:hypothetical protein
MSFLIRQSMPGSIKTSERDSLCLGNDHLTASNQGDRREVDKDPPTLEKKFGKKI